MSYVRHDENNNPVSPQPTSTTVNQFSGTEGWSTVTYQDWNADYQARNPNNTPRTPATYLRHNENCQPIGSVEFDGNGDYLNVSPIGTEFADVLQNDLTVEFWMYWPTGTTLTSFQVVSGYADEFNIFVGETNVGIWDGGTPFINLLHNDPNIRDNWHHVAIVRTGGGSGEATVYWNGTSLGTSTWDRSYSNLGLYIGANYTNSQWSEGWLSNFRIVKSAVYTANFTPPTTSFGPDDEADTVLLCCQGTTVDRSNGNETITAVGNASGSGFSPFSLNYQRHDVNNAAVSG